MYSQNLNNNESESVEQLDETHSVTYLMQYRGL